MGRSRVEPTTIVRANGDEDIAAGGTSTYYSAPFRVDYGSNFALEALVTSPGTVNLDISIEQSNSDPVDTLSGSIPVAASDANWVVPDGVSALYSGLNDEVKHLKSFSPLPTKWARLKIEGNAGNNAGTYLNAKIHKIEDF